jgi:hypothetical protein
MTPSSPRDAAIRAIIDTLRRFQAADNGVAVAAEFDNLPLARRQSWLDRGGAVLDAAAHALHTHALMLDEGQLYSDPDLARGTPPDGVAR